MIVDDDALKKTVSPEWGSVGEKTKFAEPAGKVVEIVIWREVVAVSPASLITLSVTAKVPPRVYRCVTGLPVALVPSPKSQV